MNEVLSKLDAKTVYGTLLSLFISHGNRVTYFRSNFVLRSQPKAIGPIVTEFTRVFLILNVKIIIIIITNFYRVGL